MGRLSWLTCAAIRARSDRERRWRAAPPSGVLAPLLPGFQGIEGLVVNCDPAAAREVAALLRLPFIPMPSDGVAYPAPHLAGDREIGPRSCPGEPQGGCAERDDGGRRMGRDGGGLHCALLPQRRADRGVRETTRRMDAEAGIGGGRPAGASAERPPIAQRRATD
jgi:hypothetical protein